MDDRKRIDAFVAAIQPLVKIADAYEREALDEARPGWNRPREEEERVILFSGRGGAELLTLGDCFAARDAYRNLKQMTRMQQMQPVAVEQPVQEPAGPRKRAINVA